MNIEEYLYACVEAGVALSGFAALALAIRSRSNRDYTPYERAMIASLIERGLASAGFALIPLLLRSFELHEQSVWPLCSGLFFVYGGSIVVRAIPASRTDDFQELVGSRIFLPIFAIGVAVLLAQLINVLPIGVTQGARWYLLAITWLLFSAGYVFLFILRAWVRAA